MQHDMDFFLPQPCRIYITMVASRIELLLLLRNENVDKKGDWYKRRGR